MLPCGLPFQCFLLVCFRRYLSETLRVRDRSTSPSASSSHQVRGSIYHAYNFHLTLPSYRIDRLLDPTTSYFASQINPKSHVPHILANHCLAMYLAFLT